MNAVFTVTDTPSSVKLELMTGVACALPGVPMNAISSSPAAATSGLTFDIADTARTLPLPL